MPAHKFNTQLLQMAGDLLPPELSVPNLPPEKMDDEPVQEPEESITQIPLVLEEPEPDPEDDMVEDDDAWEGMETAEVSTVTAVIGPDEDLMEDDDEGTGIVEWEQDQWLKLDPLSIESTGYSDS